MSKPKKQNMKKHFLYHLCIICTLWSCVESEIGQYPIDGEAPGQVENITVENLKGAAIISYDIPDDEDLLYVKAIYRLDNGDEVEQKASAYVNSIRIEGLGKSRQQEVLLVTGDRSRNESQPVTVTIHPEDAPIYDVFSSLHINNDFGGIRLEWDNETKADVVITVLELDESNELVEIEHFYTRAEKGKGNVRGYAAQEKMFAVYVRDRWQNHSDTLIASYTPLHEERLDKSKFQKWNPPGIPYRDLWGQWTIEKLWDGSLGDPGFSMPSESEMPNDFTFDLGQWAQISRFKIFQRATGNQTYTGANAKKFEVWGSEHPNVNADFSTWVKLGDFESIKPSGPGPVTAEDIQYAGVDGEDFNIEASPRIRYLRFIVHETWGGASYVQMMEVEFFGSIQ